MRLCDNWDELPEGALRASWRGLRAADRPPKSKFELQEEQRRLRQSAPLPPIEGNGDSPLDPEPADGVATN